MNISELINFGSNLLKENKIKSHILDAEILLSKTLNKSREDIIINFDKLYYKADFGSGCFRFDRGQTNYGGGFLLE